MKTSTQMMMRTGGAALIITTLAISAILCAPQQQNSGSATKSGSSSAQSTSPISKPATTAAAAAASQPKSSSSQLSSAASVVSGSPSFVNLKSSAAQASDELDTFDGKNPFSDDSLWQIPVHLVRDVNSAGANEANLQRSASEMQNVDEEDDDEFSGAANSKLAQSSSTSPTIISASTDLKTAAGYHYPTHGHGYGHEAAPSHGHGSYGGDHYGKYFQYASVPYPHAWEFGYRRGNPYHTIERYEHGKGPHFQTKVKWSDKHAGYGVHVWDYNHDDHHSHHYGGHESHGPSHYSHGSSHHGYGHH